MSINKRIPYDQNKSISRRERAIRAYMHGQHLLEVCGCPEGEINICVMDCEKCRYSLSNIEKSKSEARGFVHISDLLRDCMDELKAKREL